MPATSSDAAVAGLRRGPAGDPAHRGASADIPGVWAVMGPVRGRIGCAMVLASLLALGALAWAVHELLLRPGAWPWRALAAAAALLVAGYTLRLLAFNQSHFAAFRLETVLRTRLAEHLARVPLGWTQQAGSGALAKIVQDDVKALHVFVADSTPLYARAYVAPVATCAALVGPSGAGKTTVTRLLMRHADPQRGRVLIGGADVRAIPPEKLNALISAVFQDVYLFDDSILANIRMAKPEATDAEVEAAARAAHRLSTIAAADRILVIDGGRLVEQGRHAELLAANGRYRAMWEAQMRVKAWAALRTTVPPAPTFITTPVGAALAAIARVPAPPSRASPLPQKPAPSRRRRLFPEPASIPRQRGFPCPLPACPSAA